MHVSTGQFRVETRSQKHFTPDLDKKTLRRYLYPNVSSWGVCVQLWNHGMIKVKGEKHLSLH